MCDCAGVSNIFSPTFGIPGSKIVFGNGSTLPSLNVNLVLEIMRVRLATTADLGATYFSPNILQVPGAPASIDGVAVDLLDRILVKDQANEEENGVYQVISVAGPTVLQRVADFRPNKNSTIVDVEEGTDNECTLWYNSRDTTLTVGIDPIKFIPMSGGGGTGSVVGIPPTVVDNIVLWADATATTIKDSGVSINDILAALNQIITVTLTGTAFSTITTDTEGAFLISVKNIVTDGPSAVFSITKNEGTELPSINTLSSSPGTGTGEVLELQWNVAGDLELRKDGIAHDGDYTVTIFGNGAIPGGGDVTNGANLGGFAEVFDAKVGTILNFRTLQAGAGISITQNANDLLITNTGGGGTAEIGFQMVGIETIINNPVSFTPIAYFPWDPVENASFTNGRLTVNTNMSDLTFDIRYSTSTLGVVGTFNVVNLGISRTTTFTLPALPVLEDRLIFEVIQVGAGVTNPSMYGMSLRFDQ